MKTLKVVKIGGKLIEDDAKLSSFLLDFAALKGPKILVHGGGNFATEIASRLGYETKLIDGRRITDKNSLDVIVMTYGGLINKSIVAKLQGMDTNSIGLCGADGKSIISVKREVSEIDYGFVGDISEINSSFIISLLNMGITPVFSAISVTNEGELLNTNGDSVAAEIASAMSSYYTTELYYCFEKKGVLENAEDENSVIKLLDRRYYEELKDQKIISDGMLPKLHNCFHALDKGVSKIFLSDFTLLKNKPKGTQINK